MRAAVPGGRGLPGVRTVSGYTELHGIRMLDVRDCDPFPPGTRNPAEDGGRSLLRCVFPGVTDEEVERIVASLSQEPISRSTLETAARLLSEWRATP